MALLKQDIKKALKGVVGTRFWISKTITSSGITTAAQDLSDVATGRLAIINAVCKTDSTGLAGGTNFVLSTTNAKGTVNFAVETVANLGASITKSFDGPAAGDTTTSDCGYTVTQSRTILESGKKIQYNTTGSAGTGAGTVDVFILLERVDENALVRGI